MEETVKIVGIEDLEESIKKMINKYPDEAGECLRAEARKTRKEIVKNAKETTKTKVKSRQSLGKIGSYRISQVQGFRENQYVEISARAKHFHLVERGHVIKMPDFIAYKNKKTDKVVRFKSPYAGQTRGRVQGKFFLKKAREEEAERFPEVVSQMLDTLIHEAGF